MKDGPSTPEPHTRVQRRLRPVDLAREHALSAQAIRTYERDGVLPPATRTVGGHRTYTEVHVRALRAFVTLIPAVGHASARELLRAVHDGGDDRLLRLVDDAHDRLRRDRATLDTVAVAVGVGVDHGGGEARPNSTEAPGPPLPDVGAPLSVGELARRLGVVPATLRAWERAGVLSPARDRAGQRRYGPADVRDAELAALLRRGGTGLARIAVVVDQVRDAGGTAELAASLTDWRERLRTRGRALLAGTAALDACLDGPWKQNRTSGSPSSSRSVSDCSAPPVGGTQARRQRA